MLNALYSVEWISPNGMVRGTDEVAARSNEDASRAVILHRGDGYVVRTGALLGDLNETDERDVKYSGRATWLRQVAVR